MALVVFSLGCVPKPTPVETWQTGDHQAALNAQKLALAESDERDRALEALRLGSMAYAGGNRRLAESSWREAVGLMTDFRADGEFAALVGSEDKKAWKGEPYEKMAAFLSLGLLLHEKGDRDNALAMYKSAVLADTGSASERYRSDFVPAWLMQAIAFTAENEPGNAEQSLNRGIDAWCSRNTIDILTDALATVKVGGLPPEDKDLARAVLLAALPGGTAAQPRDPVAAVTATTAWATELLKVEREKDRKDRLPELTSFRASHFDRAADALPKVSAAWAKAVAARPDASGAEAAWFDQQLRALIADPPSVLLVVEQGRGPIKMQTGDHGEVLTIVPSRSPANPPRVIADGGPPANPLLLDSLSYQATTRGGRKVDGFLKGKAVYKDVSMVSAYVLNVLSDVARASGNDSLGDVGQVISAVLFVSSLVTNPAADIRQWELAPERWYLVPLDLDPGPHRIDLAGRRIDLTVPERGQVVHLVPALAPGGPTKIPTTE